MLEENGWLNVEVKAGNRTLSQNALYWEWVTYIANELNRRNKSDFKPNEIHMRMKHEFLGYTDPMTVGGCEIPAQLRSTAKLTKGEMFDFMNKVDMFWAERGVLLPTPQDSVYGQLKVKDAGEIS